MRTILRIFFHFLYHQLAFAYDLVAAVVSFGHWKNWISEVIPFVTGTQILELGHGPGHLQRILLSRNLFAIAIDESTQMGTLAKHNTRNSARLTRGLAQHLPFANTSFDTIIATFPAEYITDPHTLSEVTRCLHNGGRFIVLPVAMPRNRFLSWLFKITKQAPSEALEIVHKQFEEPFEQADFKTESHLLDVKSGTLIVVVAKKKEK